MSKIHVHVYIFYDLSDRSSASKGGGKAVESLSIEETK